MLRILCEQLGVFTPKAREGHPCRRQVGYVTAGIRELRAAKVGDTLTHADKPARAPLPGFKEVKPQVFRRAFTRWRRASTRHCATRSRSCI